MVLVGSAPGYAQVSVSRGSPTENQKRIILGNLRKLLQAEDEIKRRFSDELDQLTENIVALEPQSRDTRKFKADYKARTESIEDQAELMLENQLRIEFLTAFLARVELANDVIAESPRILREMSQRQLVGNFENGDTPKNKLWLFELNLAMTIKSVFEPREDFVGFIKQYLVYSTLRDPVSPADFVKFRGSYLGGSTEPVPKITEFFKPRPEASPKSTSDL